MINAEFLTDLDDVANHTTVTFHACERLGAINLRGTGFATGDFDTRTITLPIAGRGG